MAMIKKIGFYLGLVASALIIGTTVAGWVNDKKNNDKDNKTETAQIVQVIE